VLEGVIPLETFPLVEWLEGELADVPSFTVLKTQICLTRPQCVKKARRAQTSSTPQLKLEILSRILAMLWDGTRKVGPRLNQGSELLVLLIKVLTRNRLS